MYQIYVTSDHYFIQIQVNLFKCTEHLNLKLILIFKFNFKILTSKIIKICNENFLSYVQD